MIFSMTAFAHQEVEVENFTLAWELRAVNHRYLDLSLRLPEDFRSWEPEIRARIAAQLRRGRVEGSLKCKRSEGLATDLRVDFLRVRQLLATAARVEGLMAQPHGFTALDVIRWPGVLLEPDIDLERFKARAFSGLDGALEKLLEGRRREGERLAGFIAERCGQLRGEVGAARRRVPDVLENLRAKLLSRMAELALQPDRERLEQEMVYFAQKMSVDEELDRLDAHLDETMRILEEPSAAGRRLDFLLQEMNREANTLGSKSADGETTRTSVQMKVLIEQMREQVQNIE